MNITYADYIDTILDSNFIFGWDSKPKYKKRSYKYRIGTTNINYQGYEMKIIKYNNRNDMIVEFNDSFHTKKHCGWKEFKKGEVKNPNVPTVYGVGIVGDKYPTSINKEKTKEYETWKTIIKRCYSENKREKNKTYEDCKVSEEWKYFPNFYEWIINQPNYEKWKNNKNWHIDKDIIKQGNKIYDSKYCCLVPNYINVLVRKKKERKSNLPVGVVKNGNKYSSFCSNPINKKKTYLGTFDTPEEAFQSYKKYREELNETIAEQEYIKGNITEKCRDGLINYKI